MHLKRAVAFFQSIFDLLHQGVLKEVAVLPFHADLGIFD
jgi:hypothetical protein